MKALASDLESFLKGVDTPGVTTPAAQIEAEAATATVTAEPVDKTTDPTALVRAAWDYVSSKVQESEGPERIGEAFMLAVAALSQDAAVPIRSMQKAAIDFLESIVEAARESV